MNVEVDWRRQAVEQLNALPVPLQAAARQLVRNLRANPYVGNYSHTVTLASGATAYVHVYAGTSMTVEFYRRGWFRQTLVIVIHNLRVMDWPSIDDYQERTRL